MSTILQRLVCGDVDGHFKALFKKVGTIHQKKGPFEYLLCVGNFFGSSDDEWEDVKAGKITVPLTTYILGPNTREQLRFYPDDSSEIVPNLIFLGKRGVLTGSSGLKIAYLSGLEKKETTDFSFSEKDVTELIAGASNEAVDILLTSQWPQGVTKYAKPLDFTVSSSVGSNLVAHLVKLLKPRYHFSGLSGLHYERLPYRNHQVLQELPMHTTRFIGLAMVDNEKKLKWLYAFNITPSCSMTSKELATSAGPVTECPFGVEDRMNQFFYDTGSRFGQKRTMNGNERCGVRKKKHAGVLQEHCWFCLTNPDIQKQLLLSIGNHSYMTLAKGGLVRDHLLIIPMEHVASSVSLSESAEKEVENYKRALVEYFHSQDLNAIFFERNFTSPHLQIQAVPIPKSLSSGAVKTIIDFASAEGLEFTELSKFSALKQVVSRKKSYFYVEIIDNKNCSGKLLHVIDGNFPLQFGRMMLASRNMLNLPNRVDWKECKMSPDEELRTAENFRRHFKKYDFTKI
ncbi:CWF19-like protein 1 [Trichonephila clavata]|uniref:CWF19-like protein 1 n=1 Tax=Trichonephila clavata TaxID=2740835 RepID=A0A8X6L9H5_TRICU|nr:CWF19-like protein 1 [Trichonephila clavata]